MVARLAAILALIMAALGAFSGSPSMLLSQPVAPSAMHPAPVTAAAESHVPAHYGQSAWNCLSAKGQRKGQPLVCFDPLRVSWADELVDETEFRVDLIYRNRDARFAYSLPPDTTSFVFPAEAAPPSETCLGRKEYQILVTARTEGGEVVVGGIAVNGECDLRPSIALIHSFATAAGFQEDPGTTTYLTTITSPYDRAIRLDLYRSGAHCYLVDPRTNTVVRVEPTAEVARCS